MKAKSIIMSALLLLGAGTLTTSCEDMLEAENKLVTTDLEPQDTVYQMLGIINAMQKVVDPTILLGEVRADLVDLSTSASTDLQLLSSNDLTTGNAYNDPTSFYAVINNCNIYLAHVDTALKTKGEYYYEKEIISAKTFRAWAYLELAKIYGKVPFVTEPVLTASAAEDIVKDNSNRQDLVGICDYFIEDLLQHVNTDRNKELIPSYTSQTYFIPLRVMLGELYLYRGSFTQNQSDFVEAVRYYHDYLAFTNETRPTWEPYYSTWQNENFNFVSTSRATSTTQPITCVPMDSIGYYGGNYSELRAIFCAQLSNNYYAPVTPSARLKEISQAQQYCFVVDNGSVAQRDTLVGHPEETEINGAMLEPASNYVGDLRYSAFYQTESRSDQYHPEYSKTRQTILKYSGYSSRLSSDTRIEKVTLFRTNTIYLHLAEALNRAGFPESAFAILKYGISETVLSDSTKVSTDEYTRLQAITSVGFASNAADWDQNDFYTIDRATGSFLTNLGINSSVNQYPIHFYGCGDVNCNKNYYLPTDSSGLVTVPVDTFTTANLQTAEDTIAHEALLAEIEAAKKANAEWLASDEVRSQRIAALDLMILEEEALELAYEGTRFYDLMRYAKYTGNTAFLGETIAKRKGEDNYDSSLAAKLSSESGWYLPLPNQ